MRIIGLDLRALSPPAEDEIARLRAALATAEDFQRLNLERAEAAEAREKEVGKAAGDHGYVPGTSLPLFIRSMASDRNAQIDERHRAEAALTEARAEIDQWTTWGVIEIAVRNPNVSSYISHWEGRATKAEALTQRLSAEIDAAWQYIEHGYDIEDRAFFEQEAPTNGFKYALAQAMHHIWKRNPKVQRLSAALQTLIKKWRESARKNRASQQDRIALAFDICADDAARLACGFDAALTGEPPEPRR